MSKKAELEKIYQWLDDHFEHEFIREAANKKIMPLFIGSCVASEAISQYLENNPSDVIRWAFISNEAGDELLMYQDHRQRPFDNEEKNDDAGFQSTSTPNDNQWMIFNGLWVGIRTPDGKSIYCEEAKQLLPGFAEIDPVDAMDIQKEFLLIKGEHDYDNKDYRDFYNAQLDKLTSSNSTDGLSTHSL